MAKQLNNLNKHFFNRHNSVLSILFLSLLWIQPGHTCMGGRVNIPLDDTFFVNNINLTSSGVSLNQKDNSTTHLKYEKNKWIIEERTNFYSCLALTCPPAPPSIVKICEITPATRLPYFTHFQPHRPIRVSCNKKQGDEILESWTETYENQLDLVNQELEISGTALSFNFGADPSVLIGKKGTQLPRIGICTKDINRWGHPSRCSCSENGIYNPQTGKCQLADESEIGKKQLAIGSITQHPAIRISPVVDSTRPEVSGYRTELGYYNTNTPRNPPLYEQGGKLDKIVKSISAVSSKNAKGIGALETQDSEKFNWSNTSLHNSTNTEEIEVGCGRGNIGSTQNPSSTQKQYINNSSQAK